MVEGAIARVAATCRLWSLRPSFSIGATIPVYCTDVMLRQIAELAGLSISTIRLGPASMPAGSVAWS